MLHRHTLTSAVRVRVCVCTQEDLDLNFLSMCEFGARTASCTYNS